MTRFPFTPEGFTDKQTALYRLSDSDLQKEALLLSEDFLLWISRHFEIEVFLLEDLRNLGETVQLQLGWCMASSLLARRIFVLEGRTNSHLGQPDSIDVSFQVFFSASFECSTGAPADGGPKSISIRSASCIP